MKRRRCSCNANMESLQPAKNVEEASEAVFAGFEAGHRRAEERVGISMLGSGAEAAKSARSW